jgi:hypothetical protein
LDFASDSTKAIVGLRPSFSAHVRWSERGAPVRFPLEAVTPQAPQALNRLFSLQLQAWAEALTAYGHLHGYRFQLRQVIQVVTGHGFNELAEGHFAALGMQNRLCHRLRRY